MENFVLIGTILAIHIFAWFTPGPLFVLIIRNSLVYSRRSGYWTAVGIAIGNFIHIAYSIAGVTLIISSASDVAITLIKFLGVFYLGYLGIKTLLTKTSTQNLGNNAEKHKDISAFNAARTGFVTNILSPKASLFFASIFATLIASDAPNWVIGFLWIAMPLNSLLMASLLSTFFTQKSIRSAYARHENSVNIILGAALLILAGLIAIS